MSQPIPREITTLDGVTDFAVDRLGQYVEAMAGEPSMQPLAARLLADYEELRRGRDLIEPTTVAIDVLAEYVRLVDELLGAWISVLSGRKQEVAK